MPSFNLVDRGWIPCTRTDGEVGEYGLEYVLSQAHDILEISAPSPLVTVAVHRLLLAILHRNFGPRDMAHWSELWQKKRWDSERLSSYFGDWHDRFDLFHPQRPFYQVLEMQDTRRHPATLLALEAASLNNATLFDHSVDEDRKPLQASEAARYLVARQSFSIGGGKSKPFNLSDSPLIRGVNVLALGDNLFETLALNLLPYSSDYPIPGTAQDAPAWEQNEPRQPDREGSVPYGYLDYLTWQSRRIHLFPERGSDQIRTCQIQQNLKLGESTVVDPFKCYTVPKDKKRGREELGLSSERAMWRDSHALFQEVPGQSSRPELANWLARVERVRRDGEIEARAGYRIS
ncbi:MAG: type I-E CRISPR-associated protein Cse1/CasA, partial [bacterium]